MLTSLAPASPDIVSVGASGYTVQVHQETGQRAWRTCIAYGINGITGSSPATFSDIVDAENFMNEMRDKNLQHNYRMIQTLTVVQVVHA